MPAVVNVLLIYQIGKVTSIHYTFPILSSLNLDSTDPTFVMTGKRNTVRISSKFGMEQRRGKSESGSPFDAAHPSGGD